ncbi:MAG: molecular chaperone GrpE [Adhaeribacter sp.]|jgi:molecular chaperone GrpE|nr:molecular chaperone GrpE [Adhaeribacter sp.]
MSADNHNLPEEETKSATNTADQETSTVEAQGLPSPEEAGTDPAAKLEEELTEMKDKYLRLYSEFDNYKRRTSKERLDLLKTANQEMVVALLPVIDDFERARQSMQQAQDVTAVKEGVDLIFNKMFSILQQKGLKPMETVGEAFDADIHEAITQIPAPDESQKGKVIDEVEKGYYLHDKVVRFAKVVIGA